MVPRRRPDHPRLALAHSAGQATYGMHGTGASNQPFVNAVSPVVLGVPPDLHGHIGRGVARAPAMLVSRRLR